jgi:heat shock protein HslJ
MSPGCNQGSATWAAVGGGIRITDLGLTKMACPGAAGELEAAVVAVLSAGTIAATIESDLLTLQAGARGLQLRAG